MPDSNPRLFARRALGLAAALLFLGAPGSPPSAAAPLGSVVAWGDNQYGQLGDNPPPPYRTTPDAVLGPGGADLLTGVRAIYAAGNDSLALKQDGTVWAWGENSYGQLGDGTTADRATPVQVLGPGGAGFLTGVQSIYAGGGDSLALKQDGTVWAWGLNQFGQLGDGTTTQRDTPVQVLGPGGAGFLTGVQAIYAGVYHTLALKQDGTVWAWGANFFGGLGDGTSSFRFTPVQVLGPGGTGFLTGVQSISGGYSRGLALKQDGTVWAWGYNGPGALGDGTSDNGSHPTPTQVVGPGGMGFLTGVQSISGGYNHSLALKQDGTVWGWGDNYYGELGDGTTTSRTTPVQVLEPGGAGFLTGVQFISGGDGCSLALKQDGTVWAWGGNFNGQLGDGTTTERTTPVQVVGSGGSSFISGVQAISAGDYHSLALKQDGTVWAWGDNSEGQLGDGTTAELAAPVQVVGPEDAGFLTGVQSISAGYYHSLALKQDGTVWAWGYNGYGALGDGTATDRHTPVQVLGPGGAGFLSGVQAISAGEYHSLALKQDGTVWAWGDNYNGELGDGTDIRRATPVQVLGPGGANFLTGVQASYAAGNDSLALKQDGTVWAWGENSYGQLGDGTTADRTTPVQVLGPGGAGFLTGVQFISGGAGYSLALKQDGTVWAWGLNQFGQLGDGTTTNRTTPVQVLGPGGYGFLTGVTAVSAEYRHCLALKQDGSVCAWGWNDFGQLGDGTTTNRTTPVQVLGPGGTGFLTGVQSISAGGDNFSYGFSLALKQDGTVWTWGDNSSGELGDGTYDNYQITPVQVVGPGGMGSLQGISAISAGGHHNLAIQVSSPSIIRFTPGEGTAGTSVSLTGLGFTGATAVSFNGVGAGYTVISDTQISTTVPPGATTGLITVTVPAGTADSPSSFVIPFLSTLTFSPNHGSLGSTVVITGAQFTGATAVNFNGAASIYTIDSDAQITATVPYDATTGPISITTPAGTGISASNFTIDAPAIASFTPNNGSISGTVTITGSAFTGVSGVKFNGVGANYAVDSDTQITATVPFGATTGPISVTSPAGTGTSATNFTINPPSITNFSPTSGPIGSFVTLTGSSFTGVTALQFGGVSANFFYTSDTQINATVPPGFVSGLISVITPAGTGDTSALSPGNFTVPGPVITDLSPNNGSLRSIVVITGTGFTSATAVTFNGVSANYYINLDSQIVAFVPDTATSGPVTVTTPSGTSPGVTFTVNPPVITGLSPTHGSLGSYVTISGSGFTLASGVNFGGVAASFFVSTDSSISAQVPTGFVSGTISVTGPIGTGTSAGTFTVDAPTITDFSPASGPAGTNVTVNGSGFTGATSIQFNGVSASLFVANDGHISTTVPAGATTGPITVTGPGGTATSATNFTVQ